MGFSERIVGSPTTLSPVSIETGTEKPKILPTINHATRCGLMDQMTLLFSFSTKLFEGLVDDASKTSERIKSITQRVDALVDQVPQTQHFMQTIDPSVTFGYQRLEYNNEQQEDQQLFSPQTLPLSVKDSWDRCKPPPNLALLDTFDPSSSCLKKYTNPNFFIEQWAEEMKRKIDEDRQKRKERREQRKAKVAAAGKATEKRTVKQIDIKRKHVNALGAEFSSPGPSSPHSSAPTATTAAAPASSSSSSSSSSWAAASAPTQAPTLTTTTRVSATQEPSPRTEVASAEGGDGKKDKKSRDKKSKSEEKKGHRSSKRSSTKSGSSSLSSKEALSDVPPPSRIAPPPPPVEDSPTQVKASTATITPEPVSHTLPPPVIHVTPTPTVTPAPLINTAPSSPPPITVTQSPPSPVMPTKGITASVAPAPPPPPAAPMPPPPPPVISHATGTTHAPSTNITASGGGLAAALAGGVSLRTTSGPQTPSSVNPRSNLLSSIQQGIALKKVERVEQKPKEVMIHGFNVAKILARRDSIADSDSDDDDDDDDWDD
eukprot:TRINITY_DN552_c1_g2_i1.p1 TRINITY_DN552_c1_g2~~TRINITY_DN552_c1_g2_i1.p1  ORF type:complete len:556 (-),score=258.43 TRINITY_DN552_c1_g2_i1:97-1731(-)